MAASIHIVFRDLSGGSTAGSLRQQGNASDFNSGYGRYVDSDHGPRAYFDCHQRTHTGSNSHEYIVADRDGDE